MKGSRCMTAWEHGGKVAGRPVSVVLFPWRGVLERVASSLVLGALHPVFQQGGRCEG